MQNELALVDEVRCRSVAAIIKTLGVPNDEEDTSIESLATDELADFYLLLVSICHQTQSLCGTIDGVGKRGWDYLRSKLLNAVLLDRTLLTCELWSNLTPNVLKSLFRDSTHGSTLSGIEERVTLVRDLAARYSSLQIDSIQRIYEQSGGYVDQADSGLLFTLSSFRAFSDPVQKKSFFFLGLMGNTGCWTYLDAGRIGAPVDYHEVRGHLRLGTVTLGADIDAKIRAGESVSQSEDVAIRAAVAAAISLVANECHCTPMQLHYLFWNLFRNVCVRDMPHCFEIRSDLYLPERYNRLLEKQCCPLNSICESAGNADGLIEHSFTTDWY